MHQIHESNDKLVNTKEFRKQKAYRKRLLRTTVKTCKQICVCRCLFASLSLLGMVFDLFANRMQTYTITPVYRFFPYLA